MSFIQNIPATTTDEQLLHEYKQSGELQYLGDLYARYMQLVYGVCLKYLKQPENAQDSVIAIYEELLVKLQKHEVDNFKGWLYTLSKNHCLMRLRDRQGKTTAELNDRVSTKAGDETDWVAFSENEHTLELMESALAELNPEQRQCVTLFYLQKKSYQEISIQTGFTLMQVKSYIQNGKRNLRQLIEKKLKPGKSEGK